MRVITEIDYCLAYPGFSCTEIPIRLVHPRNRAFTIIYKWSFIISFHTIQPTMKSLVITLATLVLLVATVFATDQEPEQGQNDTITTNFDSNHLLYFGGPVMHNHVRNCHCEKSQVPLTILISL